MTDDDFEKRIRDMNDLQFDCFKKLNAARKLKNEAECNNFRLKIYNLEMAMTALLKTEESKLRKLLNISPKADDDQKVAQLLAAFLHGAKLGRVWKDVMGSQGGFNRVLRKIYTIPRSLDAMGGSGRAALAPFIDQDDTDAKALAADVLTYVMPEKALPALKELAHSERMLSAGWTATFALIFHEYGVGKPDDAPV